jgi:hypothetical protein
MADHLGWVLEPLARAILRGERAVDSDFTVTLEGNASSKYHHI